jgi:hypothetical protein
VSANPSVEEIATALATALEAVPGLNTADYLSDRITPPVALVAIETVDYHGSFNGGDVVHEFSVHLIAGRTDTEAGIKTLEAFMSQGGSSSTTSIPAALEADRTLGGVVSSLKVTKGGPMTGLAIDGNPAYVWVPFSVEVHA